MTSAIFQPLRFRNLEVKNRVFRSSISGRFDNYDGSGTEVRLRWDLKFARGGVGAIISSNAPVHPRGLIVPNYAHLDADDKIPFWRELGKRSREYGCKYLAQIAYSGRQRDIPGITYAKGLSSTDKSEPIHGLPCERATIPQIREIVERFAQAARRAREAELDGIEIHGVQRLPDHAVPLARDQRPQRRVRRLAGEPRAVAARDRPGDPARGG